MNRTTNWLTSLVAGAMMATVSACASDGQGNTTLSSRDLSEIIGAGVTIAETDWDQPADSEHNVAQKSKGERTRDTIGGLLGALQETDKMPLETERELGSRVALDAFTNIGELHPSPELQEYVNLVGRTIARNSDRPTIPWSFAVLVDDTPNAFAGPGGYIFVTTGTLARMKTESELAGVLAHEIAHVTQRHMLKTFRRSQLWSGLSSGAALVSDNPDDFLKIGGEVNTLLQNQGYDANFEYEADRIGTEYAAMSGYDPRGLLTFLRALQAEPQPPKEGWYRTHPPLPGRLSRLSTQLNMELRGVAGAVNDARFGEMMRAHLAVPATTAPAAEPAATPVEQPNAVAPGRALTPR